MQVSKCANDKIFNLFFVKYEIILENRKVKGYKLTGIYLLGFLGIQLNIKKAFLLRTKLIYKWKYISILIDKFKRSGFF